MLTFFFLSYGTEVTELLYFILGQLHVIFIES